MPAPTGPISGGGGRQYGDDGWELSSVVLEKTSVKQGFGIAISGGKDNPHFKTGDVSIIVSDIVKGSPADGVLRIGDKLVSVNERLVDGGTHHDAVQALKAAGMQARMEIKRPGPPRPKAVDRTVQDPASSSTPKGSPKTDADRGRARKKPRDMEQESGDRHRSGRSRSRNREEGENGEKSEKGEKRRSRSRSKGREGEDGEKKRSRSRNREGGEEGEKPRRSRSKHRAEGEENGEKPRRSRSKHRSEEGAEENGEKPKRSRSKHRGEEGGEEGDKPRRSRSRHRGEEGEKEGSGAAERKSRGRSKSRSRDDLTRSKSKESLHRSKSKSRENLNGLPVDAEQHTIVLERGPQGYGFSLGHQIFIRDFAKESPADKADKLDKGDIVHEINGTKVDNLKISECIEIIKGATEQLTLTIIKKPTETKAKEEKPKDRSRPSRPAEAPEADIVKKESSSELPQAQPRKEAEHVDREEKPTRPVPVERKRDASPEPKREAHNDTTDSWAAASPGKQRYSSEEAGPSQEMEHMDDKIRRLKARPKLERRLSQMPNARVISFRRTGSVGIQVAGGNHVGIFVAAIRPDGAAAKEGLKTGDQIIMCNEIDFEDITREEAVLILLALPEDVSLVVESKKDVFDKVKKELGDNFYIRANFDHMDITQQNELAFRKGEIFNVRDTMYQGLIGYWQAQKVGKNGKMLERGVLPNKSRAEQLAIAQKMEERQATLPGRSKVQRKGSFGGTLKKQKFVSQDRLDESSFAEGVQIPAYERVVLKVADFMRPVVVLGALADLVRLKLLEEMPDRFHVPTPMDIGSRPYDRPYSDSIKLSEIRNVITKNKHCLLDIPPEGIEMLMYAQLCPIVVLLKSPSRGAVKEMRESLTSELKTSPTGIPGFTKDPLTAKQVKRVFSNASKLEEFYPHIFTAKINTHIQGENPRNRGFYNKLKDIIFSQQGESAWMPDEKPDDLLDDMVFHPPNYMSYMTDSDTEGESTSSSPVMARKHFDDEESPLPSPTEDSAFVQPAPEREPKKHREHSRDRKHRDREESSDGERRRSRHKDKDRREKREKREEEPPRPPKEEPEPPRGEYGDDYRDAPREDSRDYRGGYPNQDYREPPRNDNYDDYRRDSPRTNHRDYRPVEEQINIRQSNQQYNEPDLDPDLFTYGTGEQEPEEDLPVLRDPNYKLPQPIPDSPPSRHPPEVKPKPSSNAIRVMPHEDIQEKRRSLKKVPDYNDDPLKDYDDRSGVKMSEVWDIERSNASPQRQRRPPSDDEPPYRPPPPPQQKNDDVPEKVMTLAERMNKFQQKVTTQQKRPPPPSKEDEDAPPARPAAPRNYIVDTRNRGGAPRQDLYAQNTFKPAPQFAQVTRVSPKQQQVEEPYMNVREAQQVKSQPDSSRYPGYDYVPPHTSQNTRSQSPDHTYDYPRSPRDYDRYDEHDGGDPHYRNPPSSGSNYTNVNPRSPHDNYSIPRSSGNNTRYGSDEDYYPPYQPPRPNQTQTNGHVSHTDGGDDEPRVIATARGMFDHRGGLLESEETNVSIYIPAGALPEGRKQEVYFKVCQDSKYMPPLDSSSGETLLSPLVMCGPHGLKFRKPIELRLPHKGASNDSMAFSLKSSDSPVGHPGHWKNVKLGGKDLDSGRAYQVTDDTVSVLVDHF